MSNKKSNNSIIFLTTLGVYLGLMLVGGAAPQVFAHSALTRNFELKDEIEVSDDLENKPDGEQALEVYSSALESIFVTSTDLVDTFPVLVQQGRYDFDTHYGKNQTGGLTGVSYLGKGVSSGKYTFPILSLFKALPHSAEPDTKPLHLVFAVDSESFEFQVALSQELPDRASRLSAMYAAQLPTLKERHASAARRLIYENTQISSKENQVYIVTRLPRAGLAALLASSAK